MLTVQSVFGPDVKRHRVKWQGHQGRIETTRPVFSDEIPVKTNMGPLRGWAPKGGGLPGAAPFGLWQSSKVKAALRHDRINAPSVSDCPGKKLTHGMASSSTCSRNRLWRRVGPILNRFTPMPAPTT